MEEADAQGGAPAAPTETAPTDEYTRLMGVGAKLLRKGNYANAAKAYSKAIMLESDRPGAYHDLAVTLGRQGDEKGAAQMFLQAMVKYPAGTEAWAECAVWAFNSLLRPQCDDVAKPDWWNDEKLMALSSLVASVMPQSDLAHVMRGEVLSARAGKWPAEPRSSETLREASMCFERAADLADDPRGKASLRQLAHQVTR